MIRCWSLLGLPKTARAQLTHYRLHTRTHRHCSFCMTTRKISNAWFFFFCLVLFSLFLANTVNCSTGVHGLCTQTHTCISSSHVEMRDKNEAAAARGKKILRVFIPLIRYNLAKAFYVQRIQCPSLLCLFVWLAQSSRVPSISSTCRRIHFNRTMPSISMFSQCVFFSPLLSLAVVAIVIKHIRNPKRENAADCNRLRANYAYAINIEAPRGEWEQCIMLFPFEHFRIFTVHRAGALSFTDSSMPQLRSCAKKCIPINEYVCAPNKCSFPFIVLFLFVSLTQ